MADRNLNRLLNPCVSETHQEACVEIKQPK